jgi:O-acetyl-ADP-ribose deacetylase (regulator of RNase III)
MRLRVFRGSVLDAPADAIVNAANTELRHGGGVAAAIARAAGPELERESRQVAPCPLGGAVVTGAGRLPFRCVLHVPTIDYRSGGRRATAREIADGVTAALRLAAERGCRRVAFPILGAGVAGIPPEEACRAMQAGFAAAEKAGTAVEEVVVCAFSPTDQAAVDAVFGPPAAEPPTGLSS